MKIGMDTRQQVAANLIRAMDRAGFTSARQLAIASGVSAPQVRRILAGESGATADAVQYLAEALGVPVWCLFVPDELSALAHKTGAEGDDANRLLHLFSRTTDEGRTMILGIAALQPESQQKDDQK